MKNSLFLIVSLTLCCFKSNAQVTVSNNSVGTYTGQYVGWNSGMANALIIKHVANQDMEFYTNDIQRMTLKNSGELGLGTTTPAAWFHILTNGSGSVNAREAFRTDVPSGSDTYWRMYRNGAEYFRLINFTGTNALYIQAARGHLRLASGDGGNAIESLEIIGGSGSDAWLIGIGDYGSFTAQRLLDVYSNSNAPQFRILI